MLFYLSCVYCLYLCQNIHTVTKSCTPSVLGSYHSENLITKMAIWFNISEKTTANVQKRMEIFCLCHQLLREHYHGFWILQYLKFIAKRQCFYLGTTRWQHGSTMGVLTGPDAFQLCDLSRFCSFVYSRKDTTAKTTLNRLSSVWTA